MKKPAQTTFNFEIDPKSMGDVKFEPLLTPEEMSTIKNLYKTIPGLSNIGVKPVNLKAKQYMSGEYKFDPEEAWIQTYSGRRFTPTNPNPDAIVIQDIAHSLSMQCRFNGHTKKFCSVAYHCVMVSYICNIEDALHGLLHDASEAYLTDFPSPLKRSGKFDAYLDFEDKVQKAICQRFGLSEKEPLSVKKADRILLATEARDFMAPLRTDWEQDELPLPWKLESLPPQEAKNLFMKRFFELTNMSGFYQDYLAHETNQ